MASRSRAMLEQGMPWRKGTGWMIVMIEGIVLAVIGVMFLVSAEGASKTVRMVLAAVLLVNSLLRIWAAMRGMAPMDRGMPLRMVASGIGLTVGLLVLLEPGSDYITNDAAKVILGIGLLAYGIVNLIGTWIGRDEEGIKWGAAVLALATIIFAFLLIYNIRNESVGGRWFGWVALIFGVALAAYGFLLRKDALKTAAPDAMTGITADSAPAAPLAPMAESTPPAPAAESAPVSPPADPAEGSGPLPNTNA